MFAFSVFSVVLTWPQFWIPQAVITYTLSVPGIACMGVSAQTDMVSLYIPHSAHTQLEKHTDLKKGTCPLSEVPCPYGQYGCSFIVS